MSDYTVNPFFFSPFLKITVHQCNIFLAIKEIENINK